MAADEQNRRVYFVIHVGDGSLTHENPFDTVEEAKAHVVDEVDDGSCEIEDVEIWEARPVLKPRKIETAWENIL